MKRISIGQLRGGEKLAKEVILGTGIVLIPKGSIIKREYILKMKELHIDTVTIESEMCKIEIDKVEEEKIQTECKIMVKETMEKFSYSMDSKLQEIVAVAEQIIKDILSEPNVLYNISQVREKSESTYSHCINVSALSVLIGLKMKLERKHIREMAIGALLHDLGIICLPLKYQNAIYEEWDEKEKEMIRNHVIIGYTMIEKEEWLSAISKEIILSHHEREDGSGYPLHVKGSKLKLETKIVSLCDEFDSFVYGNMRMSQKVHMVIDYITSEAGRKFNFDVVKNFLESVAAYPIGTYVMLNTKEIGIIIRQNDKMPTRPVLQLIENGRQQGRIVDMIKELTVFIVDTIDIS